MKSVHGTVFSEICSSFAREVSGMLLACSEVRWREHTDLVSPLCILKQCTHVHTCMHMYTHVCTSVVVITAYR